MRAAASKAGGKLLEDEALLDQVTNLVELPNPVVGHASTRATSICRPRCWCRR